MIQSLLRYMFRDTRSTMKMNSKQLRTVRESEAKLSLAGQQRGPIYFIVENVYDTYNVGGLFRLADALNVAKIYLCGETEIPPNHKIVKASIGTYKIVPWEYMASAEDAINELRITHYELGSKNPQSVIRNRGINIIAIEQAKGSVDYRKADYTAPIALLVGNETNGVLPETLKLCDQIAEIPMFGINTSLNVIVSAAIVGFHAAGAILHGASQESQL